jgi:hypothetical protein
MADVVGSELGWNALQKKTEIERSLAILADKHGVEFQSR